MIVVERCSVLTRPGRIGFVHDSRATPPGLSAILLHYFDWENKGVEAMADWITCR